jgi:hypothetical protein
MERKPVVLGVPNPTHWVFPDGRGNGSCGSNMQQITPPREKRKWKFSRGGAGGDALLRPPSTMITERDVHWEGYGQGSAGSRSGIRCPPCGEVGGEGRGGRQRTQSFRARLRDRLRPDPASPRRWRRHGRRWSQTRKHAGRLGKSVWSPLARFSSVLWLQVTGSFFAVIGSSVAVSTEAAVLYCAPRPRCSATHHAHKAQDGRLRRLGHAGAVHPAWSPSTWPCGPAVGVFDVSRTWATSSCAGRTRWPRCRSC